jgi:hypothetical protein
VTKDAKTSVYARSRAFRWGVWLLAIAGVLIAWSAVKKSTAKPDNLYTTEGTLVDYRAQTSSPQYGVQPGRRYRGSARTTYYVRIQKADGTINEFSSRYPIPSPIPGWQSGLPARVSHDALRTVYGVEIAGEMLQEAAAAQQRQANAARSTDIFGVLLLIIGLSLVAVGYLLSLQNRSKPPPTHSVPPPLPDNLR